MLLTIVELKDIKTSNKISMLLQSISSQLCLTTALNDMTILSPHALYIYKYMAMQAKCPEQYLTALISFI